MHFTRREFLAHSSMLLGACAVGYPLPSLATSIDDHIPHLVVGSDNKVCAINLKTSMEMIVEIPFRVHACIQHTLKPNRFMSIEKWGTSASEVDFLNPSVTKMLQSPSGTQYSGHGFFSANGDAVFLTVADYNSGKGYLTGYDTRDYKQISHDQITVGSLHDCYHQADGTLLVISDGLKFLRDMSDLSSQRLEPGAIIRMDLNNNHIIDRYEISDTDQALGHLKVTKQGNIFVLSTPTGDNKSRKGNIYFLKAGEKKLSKVSLPDNVYQGLKGEFLSIAIDEKRNVAAITNPHGRIVVLIDALKGEYIQHIRSTLFSNVAYDPVSNKFILGGKKIVSLDASDYSVAPYHVPNLHIPLPNVKSPGMLNGAHSLVV